MAKLSREEKIKEVVRLREILQSSKAIIFAMYRGLKVRDLTNLRKKLREQGIAFSVVKTTLLERALESAELPALPEEILSQPIGIVSSYDDEITPVKILSQTAKETDKLRMLGALIDKAFVDEAHLSVLATLPSREELVGRMIGSLSNLNRRFIWSLQYPTSTLINLLKEYQTQRGLGPTEPGLQKG